MNSKSAVWLVASQGLSAIVGLVASTLFARELGPESFGRYFLGLTVVSVATVAVDICLYQAILTGLDGFRRDAGRWLRWSLIVSAFTSVTIATMAGMFAGDDLLMWLVLCLVVPLTPPSMRARAFLLRAGKVRGMVGADIGSIVLGNGIGLILLAAGGGLLAAAASQLVLALTRWLLLEFVWRRAVDADTPAHEAEGAEPEARLTIRQYVGRMNGIYWNQFSGFLSRTGDNLLVSVIAGPVPLAFYSRAYSLMMGPLLQAQMALNGLMIHQYSESIQRASQEALLRRVALVVAFVGTPPIVVVCSSAPALTEIILGNEWDEAGRLLQLSIGIGIGSLIALPARWLMIARRSPGPLRIDGALQLMLLAGLAVGLIFGGVGGAVAVNSFVLSPVIGITVWFLAGRGLYRVLLAAMIIPVVVTGLVVGSAVWALNLVSSGPLMTVLVATGLLACAEGLALIVVRRFQKRG